MVLLVWLLGVNCLVHAGVTQRWLIEGSSLVDLLSTGDWTVVPLVRVVLVSLGGDVVPYEIVGGRAVEPEGPRERPPPLCELETTRVGVQVCPSARQPVTRIGDKRALDRHDA